MPTVLLWISLSSFAGIAFLIFACLPAVPDRINGVEVITFPKRVVLSATGILIPLTGLGFASRASWSRWLFLSLFLARAAFGLLAALQQEPFPDFALGLLFNTILLALAVWYLFFKVNVSEYFAAAKRK